jgi:hypothetical protein
MFVVTDQALSTTWQSIDSIRTISEDKVVDYARRFYLMPMAWKYSIW